MKTVLFIAYDFQPTSNIGGSIRSTKFVKHIQELGWKCIVVSLDTIEARQQGELLNSVYRVKSLTPFSKPYQITPYGWAISAWWKARKLFNANTIDLIYVACPPFPQTITAVLLKKEFNIPVVLDFRDNWSLDPYQEGSQLKKLIYRNVFPIVEQWILNKVDQIILNTPSSQQAYKNLFPDLSNKMNLITNGYDDEDFNNITFNEEKTDYLQLFYAGSFGVCGRNARLILEAIKIARNNGLKISLLLLGKQPIDVLLVVQELELENSVQLVGQVPHEMAITRMFESDVLVLYQESPKSDLQTIAGKTFEYIRSAKPILAIVPQGDNQQLILKYAIQYESVTNASAESIYLAIKHMYVNWANGVFEKKCLERNGFSRNYERKVLARTLVDLFNKVVR